MRGSSTYSAKIKKSWRSSSPQENGKTLAEARAEVQSALVEGTHHVYQASRFCGHTLPGAAAVQPDGINTNLWEWLVSSALGIFR